MYPPSFDYHRASSISEALSLLAELPDATLLAGGHALIPHLKNGRAEPGAVVDVSECAELTGVDVGPEETVVGAATTYADLLAAGTGDGGDGSGTGTPDTALDGRVPAFAQATRAVGDRQIRNRGTVGGNLAEAHPDSDLPAAALVADASVLIRGPDGEREVAVGEFLVGPFESAVGDDEIVTAVRIPHVDGYAPADADCGGAYVRKTHPTSGYAMVGVAARVAVADGTISSARVAANGVAETAVRLSSVETALEGIDADADLAERVEEAAADAATDVPEAVRRGDVHASAEYRTSVLSTYAERAVRAALSDSGTVGVGAPDATGDDTGGEPR